MEKTHPKLPPKTSTHPGVEVRGAPTRCPYCHEGVAADDSVRVCRGCLSRHHHACWGEHGRCASCDGAESLGVSEDLGPGGCKTCGIHAAAVRYSCPCCQHPVCSGCYEVRFRRCPGCAEDLHKQARRLALRRRELKRARRLTLIGSKVGLGLLLATGVLLAENEWGPTLGFLFVLPFLGLMAAVGAHRARKLSHEVEELEIELAPFSPRVGDRFWHRANGLLGRVFGSGEPQSPSDPPHPKEFP